jgi:hypothetical protein
MITDAKQETDQSGQALIELIIFLPLMFTLYSMISGFASAINGSINQQKATRAYFYYRVQNNSTLPKPAPNTGNQTYLSENWQKFGMYFLGWMDYLKDEITPVMPCYRVTIPLTPSNGDICEESYSNETSQFIRVGTVYGACGATYARRPGSTTAFNIPDFDGSSYTELLDRSSCEIHR